MKNLIDCVKKDLHGKPLKVTLKAVADNLASIANHEMGEASELTPIALVRDSGAKLSHRKINPKEVAISQDQCVYIRGLKNIWKKEKPVSYKIVNFESALL